ncbi:MULTISPECIES: helix-turn-helix transcriptional regulator [unclassified Mycobacterium]|uniref:helix-turn-helix transcriptional regulator n=1 Tax=unclassified Mycobacterium TaxID=2642494 RepID=UPI0029C8E7CD|nr:MULTISPECIES: helix-turn-helix transcriptional regulator [unclassified Mycobacterium]
MDSSNEIREFLATRRARITPQQAGLATYGRRRVPGLRREEVAMLAGVSTDYYARLERGNLTGVSDSVLEALARALRLDEAERAHLHDLARAANTTPHTRRRPASKQQLRPVVQRILDGMTALPAIVLNARLDLLGANRLAVALYSLAYDDPSRPVNLARFCFLNPHATALYPHWDDAADSTVAMLRIEAGRNPYDRDLSDLIGELSTRSETFRNRWAAHNVVLHRAGAKRFHHPVVGDLSLAYEVMELSADTGLTLTAYSPEPDSPSADGLALLASWAATLDQSDSDGTAHPAPRT